VGVFLDVDNIPEPDIFWASEGGVCQRGERYWVGPPDLIVEVLSRSTAREDWNRKFQLYERFAVREYWIVDTENQAVHVFTLRDGVYQKLGIYVADEAFLSPVLCVQVDLTGVFPEEI
jgi:Uma2 family endonuclease